MITRVEGDLLAAEVDALVNTVNCVGVMGKGIALQVKRQYPNVFTAYEQACKRGEGFAVTGSRPLLSLP